MNIHKITIQNRKGCENEWSTGNNVEVLIDGKPVDGITDLQLELRPGELARLTIEMMAQVEVDLPNGVLDATIEEKPPTVYDVVNGAGEYVGKVEVR